MGRSRGARAQLAQPQTHLAANYFGHDSREIGKRRFLITLLAHLSSEELFANSPTDLCV